MAVYPSGNGDTLVSWIVEYAPDLLGQVDHDLARVREALVSINSRNRYTLMAGLSSASCLLGMAYLAQCDEAVRYFQSVSSYLYYWLVLITS